MGVETIKVVYLGYVWLQAKVRVHGLRLQLRLNAGLVCNPQHQ